MQEPFDIVFSSTHVARAIRVADPIELPIARNEIGLRLSQHVLVLVGGADGISDVDLDRLYPFFTSVLAPLARELNAVILDGGTDSGVMQMVGRARAETSLSFPLIGLAIENKVTWPGTDSQYPLRVSLEPNHTHFVLAPGDLWGDESPWISNLASVLSEKSQSITVLVNGGEIAWKDIQQSVSANRKVVVIGGSGRTADELAAAADSGIGNKRIMQLISSRLLRFTNLTQDPKQISDFIKSTLLGEG